MTPDPTTRDGAPPHEGSEPSHLFDMYKLMVEMADRISARRATANSFFFTLHSGLAAIVGLLNSARQSEQSGAPETVDRFGLSFVAIIGLVLAAAWWLQLRSYRDLNAAKFKVINDLEHRLQARPFADEWEHLKSASRNKKWLSRYLELGFAERKVPMVFAALYVVLALRIWFG